MVGLLWSDYRIFMLGDQCIFPVILGVGSLLAGYQLKRVRSGTEDARDESHLIGDALSQIDGTHRGLRRGENTKNSSLVFTGSIGVKSSHAPLNAFVVLPDKNS